MNYYLKSEVAELIDQRQNMILVPDKLHHNIRLELKWAYAGLLNVFLNEPQFNDTHEGYFYENRQAMRDILATLMNKKVDDEKLNKYLQELIEEELLEIIENRYYLKK